MSAAFGLTTQIYNNHAKSVLLLMGFPLLLLGMLGAFCGGIATVMSAQAGGAVNWGAAWDAALTGIVNYGPGTVLATGVWFAIAFFFHGSIMRAATGSRPVTREEYPKIYNMLENLCISRGLPMPAFEIIDTPALNAFASGLGPKTFKIVLTTGIIAALKEDELEAVIAHELTHIINRDVRLLMISVIFVGIISFLSQIVYRGLLSGRRMTSSRGGRGGGGIAIIMAVAMAVLAVGYMLAAVIRFALSRKREYLADAGAVELTRNPEAMMRALQRISGKAQVPGMPQEMAQMCIENKAGFFSLFATHPPIEDRIRVISEMTNTAIPVPGPWEK